ncbi:MULTISPECIES: hemagglutinin repeat-containing protein [unclassified Pseudovibrio]|uniref:two-partner secretion domain-containing protein n=1 Tax=unclassified Pseudovibrio TaxID=2627060 RepID=UPI00187D6B05|nr:MULTISPECIES: hemagglutinin repeat-containing protein [unclassified Pseudovibrio]
MNSFFCAAFLTQGIIPAYAQSLTPDPNSNTPGVLEAPNGVPVVNIVTPTSSGLSHNKFLDFNVGKDGLILNNSTQMSPSNLGGIIEQNPNLKNGAASLILNEVTSSNRSLLQGPTEVHGQAADYILVNPNGMSCNGCGFINIPRATLSTGVPHIEDGRLKEIVVDQGSVTIGPNGLSAQETDYFDIVARSIEVNGQINAGDYLGLFAGRNTYDPATGNITARTDDGSDKPKFGIDSSALGGMYAGKITLVGTEDGVGVRAPDSIVAASGGFTLDASGKISLGSVNSAGPTRVVSRKNVEVRNSSVVYAADTLEFKAGGDLVLSPEAVVAAAGDITLNARNILANGRDIAAGIDREGKALEARGKLTLTARQDLQLGANTVLRAGKNASLQAKTINQQGRVSAEGKATITAKSYSVSGANSKLSAGSILINAADAVVLGEETQGLLSKSDLGITGGQISLLADVFAKDTVTLNSKGTLVVGKALETDGNLTVKAGDARLLEQASVLAKGTLDLTSAAALSILGALESAGAMSLKSGALTISSGARVIAKGNLISTSSSVQNAGLLASLSNLSLTSDGDVRLEDGSYVRSSGRGTFTIGGDLSVGAKALHRTTTLYSGKALDLKLNGALILTDERAGISSAKSLEIDAARLDVAGQILSADTLDLTLTNAGTSNLEATSRLASNNTLTVRGLSQDTHLINSGELYGQQGIDVRLTGTLTNNTSTARIRSGETLRLVAQTIENTGTLQANDELKVEASNGGITQTSSGQTVSLAGSIDLDSAGHTQLAGVTQAATSLNLDGQVGLTVTGSLAVKKGAATIRVRDALALTNGSAISASDLLDVQAGSIDSDGALNGASTSVESLTGDIFLGNTGTIQAEQGDLTITSAGNFDHQGKVISFGKLTVGADGSYRQHGDLAQTKAKAALDISAADISLAGEVTGLDSVTLTARDGDLNVVTGAELFASKEVSLTAARTLNIATNTSLSSIEAMQLEGASLVTSGEIQANDAISITTREGGLIHSGTIKANLNGEVGLSGEYGLKLSLQGDLVNTGTLTSGSSVWAELAGYSGPGVLTSVSDMDLNASGAMTVGSGGQIFSKGNMDLDAASLTVSSALESAQDLNIDTGALTISRTGHILSEGDFVGTVTSLDNAGVLASLSDLTLASSGNLTLQDGSYLQASGAGTLSVDGDLSIGAHAADRTATLYGAGALSITAQGTVRLEKATASIATPGILSLKAGALDVKGQIASNNNLDLTLLGAGTSAITSSGRISSSTGRLTLRGLTDGTHLQNSGLIFGQSGADLRLVGKLTNEAAALIRSDANLKVKAQSVENAGTLQSQEELKVEATLGSLTQASSGQMVSFASHVDLDSAGLVTLDGITQAATSLTLDSDNGLTLSGNLVTQTGDASLKVTGAFNQYAGSTLSAAGLVKTQASTLDVNGTFSGKAVSLESLSSDIMIGSGALIQSKQENLIVKSASEVDHQGKLISLGALEVDATGSYTQRSSAQTSAQQGIDISASSIAISGELRGLDDLTLTARDGDLNLHTGSDLDAGADLNLSAGNDLTIAGDLNTSNMMNLSAGAALIIEANGELTSLSTLDLEADTLSNAGLVQANDTLTLTGRTGGLTNTGQIKANLAGEDERTGEHGLKLSLQGDLVNSGSLYSGSSLFAQIEDYSGPGTLASIAAMDLNADGAVTIGTGGQVISQGHLNVTADALSIAGSLESAGDMNLTSDGLTINSGGRVVSEQAAILILDQDLSVENTAELHAGALNVNAANISNEGTISAATALGLAAGNSLTNTATASILSNGSLSLQAKTLSNNGGINSSVSTTVSLLDMAGAALTNTATARLESLGQLTISGRSIANEGLFSGGTGFTFTTSGDVAIKEGAVWQARSGIFTLTADGVHNEGALVSGQDLLVHSNTLNNDGGLILAKRDLTLEGQSTGTRSTQLLNHNGGAIESLEGDIILRTEDLQNLTQVTKTLKTYEYANNYKTGYYPPEWLNPRSPGYLGGSRNNNVYVNNGYIGGYSYGTMWDRSEGPTGYIFLPDIVQIEKILEDKGATPEEWNPNWWNEYAPTSLATFDPAAGHLERWNVLSPDEEHKVPSGGQAIVYIEQEELDYKTAQARISTGLGNIVIDAGSILNKSSQISAVGDLTIDGDSLDNKGVSASRTYGVKLSYNSRREHRGFGWLGQIPKSDQKTVETSTVAAAPGIIHAGGTLSGNLSGTLTNAAADDVASSELDLKNASAVETDFGAKGLTEEDSLEPNTGGQVTAEEADADEASGDSESYTLANNTQILQTNASDLTKGDSLDGSTISVPTPLIPGLGSIDDLEFGDLDLDDPATLNPRETSGQDFLRTLGLTTNPQLFTPAQDDKTYLIETRFEFVDQTSFFGLPYFAEKLGIQSLDHYGQSLGDPYFDTRLITDQVIAATGDRWISDGVGSDADQVRELMHNAAEQSETLDLTYGVSLSDDQVAQLTQDIVWYEKTVVAGHEVLIPRLYLADAKNRRNTDGAIIVAGSVNLSAGEVINTRGKISGKKDVLIAAQGTLTNSSGTISGETVELAANEIVVETLTTTTGNGQDRVGTIVREIGSVSAENSLILKSTGDTLIAGGDLSSGGTLEIGTGGNLKVTGVEARSHFDFETKGNGVHRVGVEDKTRYVTSSIQVADDLKLKSEKDITLEGALIASDGTASIEANDDVTISALEESTYSFSNSKHKGFLSGKTRRRETSSTEQVGTVVATVDDLDIKSNTGSVDITASAISSEADVTLEAAKDVNLNTAENTFQEDVLKKSHGFFAEVGGGSATVGYKSQKHKFNTDVTTNVVSSVSGENISIKAGEDVNSIAAVLNADNDLSVTAEGDINLEAVNDNYEHSESHRVDTVALSVSVFENVSGAVKTLVETPKAATAGKGNVGYQAITAVSAAVKAADAANTLVDIAQNGGTVAGITSSLTVSSEKSRSHEESSAAKVSVLNAGNDLTLIAGEDITSEGAQIDVGGDAALDAGGEMTLGAADNTMASSGKNSSKSAGISVTAGISRKGDISVSAGVNASIQNGKHESEQTYKTNSKLNVAGNLDLTSGADTTLKGAQVTARTADLDVGGDLNIESIQDTGSNSSSSAGASGGISVDIFSGNVSGNLSVNGSKGEGSRAWVTEQTGIVTEETLEIDVAGNTDLTGGLIASDTDDLTLSTGTLTFSDIDDHDKQSNIGGSVGVNFAVPGSKDTDKKPDTQSDGQPDNTSDQTDSQETEADPSYGGQFEGSYANRDKRQITRATVGEGEIIIRDEDRQQELEDSGETESVDELNRDVNLAQEVTKDVEEYVGVYVSDTAVKAVSEVGAAIVETFASLITDQAGSSPEVKEAVNEIIQDLADGKVTPAEVKACASQQSFSIFDFFISPAYADGVCGRYMLEAISLCADFIDNMREGVVESGASLLQQFEERMVAEPEKFEDFARVLGIFPSSLAMAPLANEIQSILAENPEDLAAIENAIDAFIDPQIEAIKEGTLSPEVATTIAVGAALLIAKATPKKLRSKVISATNKRLSRILQQAQTSVWKAKGFNNEQISTARTLGLKPKWINKDGSIHWPRNDGFLGKPQNVILQPGMKIDRYGQTTGGYLSPVGTPFEKRALPPNSANMPYTVYEVLKPIPVKKGPAAPWFGQPGGGTQFQLQKARVQDLIDDGYIGIVN